MKICLKRRDSTAISSERPVSTETKVLSISIGILGSALWITSSLIYAKRTALWLAPVVDIIAVLPLLVGVYWAALLLLKRFRVRRSAAVLIGAAVWYVPVGWILTTAYLEGTPKARFELLVMRPMPPSIQDFHWGGWVGMGGDHAFYVTFRSDQPATKQIIEHFQLVPVPDGESRWFLFESTNAPDLCNRAVSNWCVSWKLPYEPLTAQVAFRSSDDSRMGSYVEMVADRDYRRVYLLLW